MASDATFYLTLPSNSSMRYFPDNTLAQYKTKLPQDIDLTGRWEVGLSEIQFPHTYYNIQSEEAWMKVKVRGDDVEAHKILAPGFYSSSKELVKSVHNMADPGRGDKDKRIRLGMNDVTNKMHLRVKKGCTIRFSPKLAEMLGLEGGTYTDTPGIYYAPKMIDVHQGFYSLYVYCDLVESVVVGDVLAPLLRIVPMKGKPSETIVRAFDNIQFKPLQRNHFNLVEIDIRDDTGKVVLFNRGKVVITLAFRRARTAYL